MRTLVCVAAVVAMVHESDARACSPGMDLAHVRDPAYGSDTTPPDRPDVTAAVVRGERKEGASCDGRYAYVRLAVTASDDAAPSSRLGYRFTVVAGGDVPDSFALPVVNGGLVASDSGAFALRFDPGDEVFDFDLEVRVVDLNWNVSEAAVVHVLDDSSGCDAGSGGTKASWALVLAAALFASRPRRSRARLRQWQTPRSS